MEQMPHMLTLSDRRKLTISGVTEVASFDEGSVVAHTDMGTLVIQGQELQLKTLDGGNVVVVGQIGSLLYEEPRPAGGWLSRLVR